MLCCCEKPAEKKLTKPLLAESKSISGESKAYTGEPKAPERKLTGFESLPSPKPVVVLPPKLELLAQDPVVIRSESKPEPVPEPEPEPEPEPVAESKPIIAISASIPIPSKTTTQTVPQEQISVSFIEKNDFLPRNEKKNRKSNRR